MTRKLLCVVLSAILSFCLIAGRLYFADRRNCLCTVLDSEMRTYSIDERLQNVYDVNPASGTFSHVRVSCNHGYLLELLVFSDEGQYMGRKL